MLELHRTLSNNETSMEIQSCFLNLIFPLEVMILNGKKQISFKNAASLSHLLKTTLILLLFLCTTRAYKDSMILLCLCSWVRGIETACRRNRRGKINSNHVIM